METNQETSTPVVEMIPGGEVVQESKVIVVNDAATFELIVRQQKEAGDFSYGIKFTLPKEIGNNVDYILGTAIHTLFSKMELAKQMKTKLFDSRIPLEITIKSSQHLIELGKVEQVYLKRLKVNSGERSKLAFVDNIIALSKDLLKPVVVKRITGLHEDSKNSVQERYGKAPKVALSNTTLQSIAESELIVSAEGELAEA